MARKRARSSREVRLSPRARLAAERLAELAGVPVAEVLEIVLLELVTSGEQVQARGQGKRPRAPAVAGREPGRVIYLDRARRSPSSALRRRVEAQGRRSDAARARAEAVRRAAAEARLRCRALRSDPMGW